MALLQLTDVSKSYLQGGQAVPVLSGIQLTLQAGASAAIVGPSGCGKSTLLNVIGTLDKADSGSVLLDGTDLSIATPQQLSQIRSQKIGFIFQLHHLLPQCTVLENVLVPTLAPGISASPAHQDRAQQLLKRVGLEHRIHWKPGQLSGGERQRVAVVRALINQPKLILADEPTGALDERNATALTELLLELQIETQTALLLVTHHRAQAERMQQLLTMREGRLT
jgi:lipoprotein-releasing system ATP-binding protein